MEFWEYVGGALAEGMAILDIGAGRQPTLSPCRRPGGTHYVGLDVEASILEAAPPGSYDETIVADAESVLPNLVGRFDLIVSWQVLEHVRHMDRAASAFYEYARPGGWFVGMLSGRNAVYALANRILPARLGALTVARLRHRPLETVFQAHYDQCTDSGLRTAFSRFEDLHVIPQWHAADYFERFGPLQRLYLEYENWAAHGDHRDLATHYVVAARRANREHAG